MSSEPILQIDRLSKTFDVGGRKLHAVDEVSLDLAAGKTLGLVGESGSGKTTLGRCVVRLDQPTSGDINFDGRNLAKLDRGAMRQVNADLQMVFQNPSTSLNPRQSIGEAVGEPLLVHNRAKGNALAVRVNELLDRVGLDPALANRLPKELSGGQRQRVGVARALALEPKVLVLDEPTASLDLSVQAQVVNLLIELQEQFGLTYLFISHDLSVIGHISHRIAVMYLGKVVEVGDADRVVADPQHPYTVALMSSREPKGEGRIVLHGELPSPINRPTGCPFRSRCPVAQPECADHVPSLDPVDATHSVACLYPGSLRSVTNTVELSERSQPVAVRGA